MPIEYFGLNKPSESSYKVPEGTLKDLNHQHLDKTGNITTTNIIIRSTGEGGSFRVKHISFQMPENMDDQTICGGEIVVIPDADLVLRGGTEKELGQPIKVRTIKVK